MVIPVSYATVTRSVWVEMQAVCHRLSAMGNTLTFASLNVIRLKSQFQKLQK